MLSAGAWKLSQQNLITFVLVDSNGTEVTGLGSGFTLQISKAGGAFAASAGTKAEISDGAYSYLSTAGEADTIGPVLIRVTGGGIVTQWLEYIVEIRTISAVEWPYYVDDTSTSDPLPGAQVQFMIGNNVVWFGVTDSFGYARDGDGNHPLLDPGSYTVVTYKASYSFPDDVEVVA